MSVPCIVEVRYGVNIRPLHAVAGNLQHAIEVLAAFCKDFDPSTVSDLQLKIVPASSGKIATDVPKFNAATAGLVPPGAMPIIRRLCQLQAEVVGLAVGFDKPNDCFCDERLRLRGKFKTSGNAVAWIEHVVRNALDTIPPDRRP